MILDHRGREMQRSIGFAPDAIAMREMISKATLANLESAFSNSWLSPIVDEFGYPIYSERQKIGRTLSVKRPERFRK